MASLGMLVCYRVVLLVVVGAPDSNPLSPWMRSEEFDDVKSEMLTHPLQKKYPTQVAAWISYDAFSGGIPITSIS
jgi:hypothetical protein